MPFFGKVNKKTKISKRLWKSFGKAVLLNKYQDQRRRQERERKGYIIPGSGGIEKPEEMAVSFCRIAKQMIAFYPILGFIFGRFPAYIGCWFFIWSGSDFFQIHLPEDPHKGYNIKKKYCEEKL